jgi:hypothetical protein
MYSDYPQKRAEHLRTRRQAVKQREHAIITNGAQNKSAKRQNAYGQNAYGQNA